MTSYPTATTTANSQNRSANRTAKLFAVAALMFLLAFAPTVSVPAAAQTCTVRVCFHSPDYYCFRGIPRSVGTVSIPQINFGYPVVVRTGGTTSPVVQRYLGCGQYGFEGESSALRRLTKYYLAAQISVGSSPNFINLSTYQIGCPLMGMGPLPLTLSTGTTITATTSFSDFFKETSAAVRECRIDDADALTNVYKALVALSCTD